MLSPWNKIIIIITIIIISSSSNNKQERFEFLGQTELKHSESAPESWLLQYED